MSKFNNYLVQVKEQNESEFTCLANENVQEEP